MDLILFAVKMTVNGYKASIPESVRHQVSRREQRHLRAAVVSVEDLLYNE